MIQSLKTSHAGGDWIGVSAIVGGSEALIFGDLLKILLRQEELLQLKEIQSKLHILGWLNELKIRSA